MKFKLPESFLKRQQEIYEKQYVVLEDGTEKHVTEFKDKSVTYEEKQRLRMNSYARDKFISKLNNEALIKTTEYYLTNCPQSRYPATTYDEAIVHVLVPELIKRLEESEKRSNAVTVLEYLEHEKENLLRIIEGNEDSEFNKGRIYAMDKMIEGAEMFTDKFSIRHEEMITDIQGEELL